MKADAPVLAVFFDLDGTLADTAPDLGGALNRVRQEEGLPLVPLETLRPYTSQGVRGLLRAGMGIEPDHADYAALAERVLSHYQQNVCEQTTLFPGIADVLDELDARGIPWGVVTNKHSRFTAPLVAALDIARRAACVVSGDTAARPKPAPDPLLHACKACEVDSARCLYVGDDRRDVDAGHAASMRTIAVGWGYLGVDDPIDSWGADLIVSRPAEILDCLAWQQLE